MEEEIEEIEDKSKKAVTINGITIYRILAYFAIYSVIGYILETVFAFIMYGKIESRQGFLYGPVCPIYGVGAVVMIVALQKFKKNGYTLFLGGAIVGSLVEYLISLFGELILNVRWWDYSGRFLNINGRICLLYSIYWGLISIYLMKSLNPNIDKLINFLKNKINIRLSRLLTIGVTVILFIDCIISAVAVQLFLARTIVQKDLPAQSRDWYVSIYNSYSSNENTKHFIEKIWSDKKIIRVYPNLRLTLNNGEIVYVRDCYPDLPTYYYNFRK